MPFSHVYSAFWLFCSRSTIFWLQLNLGHILICHQKDQFGRDQFIGKSDSISKQKNFIVKSTKRNFLVVQWLRLCAPKTKGPWFDPWSGNWIPHAATKSVNATNRDPTCRNEDQRSHMLQLRPAQPNKYMQIFFKSTKRWKFCKSQWQCNIVNIHDSICFIAVHPLPISAPKILYWSMWLVWESA